MDVKLGSSAGVCANRRCVDGDGRPHLGHDGFWIKSRSFAGAPIRDDLADRLRKIDQAFIITIYSLWI